MDRAIKLRHVRHFVAVADLGSLTAAARAEGLTQPALSKSLSELQSLLGAALFARQGRRLVLTPEGEGFRRHARVALASLDAAAQATRPQGPDRLAVGLLPTVSTRFFPQVVATFLRDRPDLALSVETGSHPVLLRKLRDRQIDLMVGRMPQPAEMAGLAFEFLYEEPIIAAVRADHPARARPIGEILRHHPVILPTRESIIRETVDVYLAQSGLAGLRPAVETSTLALGRGILFATDAVWFISQGVVEAELAAGQLARIPLGATYLSGAVGMTVLQDLPVSGELARLMRLAREAV